MIREAGQRGDDERVTWDRDDPHEGIVPAGRPGATARESEAVFVGDAVDAVTGTIDGSTCVGTRATVAHLQKQGDHESFEEVRRARLDSRDDLGGEFATQPLERTFEGFFRSLCLGVV